MPLTSRNTGDTGTASDHNEIYELLRTTNAKEWITFTHKGADLASAGTLSLGGDGNYFDVTGTTGITAISSRQAGTMVILQFDGAVTLTNSASLVLQGAANVTTAAGDVLVFIADTATVWRQIGWLTASGFVTLTGTQTLTNKTLTAPTIADYTNAAHDHGDADDGGTLVAAAVNNLTLTGMTLTSPVVNTQLTGTAVGTGASQVAAGNHTHASSNVVKEVGWSAVETDESTTSTSAADLATVGPTVTMTADLNDEMTATVSMVARNNIIASTVQLYTKLDAAAAAVRSNFDQPVAGEDTAVAFVWQEPNLSAASHTLKVQYSVGANTGNFHKRHMQVLRHT